MIVCICNRLNDAKIRMARHCGAVTPDEVYAYHGLHRKCGRCHQAIEEILQENELVESLQAAE